MFFDRRLNVYRERTEKKEHTFTGIYPSHENCSRDYYNSKKDKQIQGKKGQRKERKKRNNFIVSTFFSQFYARIRLTLRRFSSFVLLRTECKHCENCKIVDFLLSSCSLHALNYCISTNSNLKRAMNYWSVNTSCSPAPMSDVLHFENATFSISSAVS